MTERSQQAACSDCDRSFNRRSFLQGVAGATLAGVAAPSLLTARFAHAAPSLKSSAETVAGKLFESLSADQKKEICFPFDHELRKRINANWHITKPAIDAKFYTKDQLAMIQDVVKNITTPEGFERFVKQMDEDSGGWDGYNIAFFGEPGSGKFQWEMTGRHLTMRADGDSVDKAAFGGPIVYGHGEEDAKANLYHYQTKKVNEVFKALDAKQAEKALLKQAPSEAAVTLQGASGKFPGLAIGELSGDQKQLVEATLKTLLSPYRADDVDEVMAILKSTGGLDKLHLAFYQQGDLNNDKVWDIWRVEGPSFVWHFRGAPHVHAYINIGVV